MKSGGRACKPESSDHPLLSISCLESTDPARQYSQFRQSRQVLCHSYGTVFHGAEGRESAWALAFTAMHDAATGPKLRRRGRRPRSHSSDRGVSKILSLPRGFKTRALSAPVGAHAASALSPYRRRLKRMPAHNHYQLKGTS